MSRLLASILVIIVMTGGMFVSPTTFSGEPAAPSGMCGEFDGEEPITVVDIQLLATHLNESPPDQSEYDLVPDGQINLADVQSVAGNWHVSCESGELWGINSVPDKFWGVNGGPIMGNNSPWPYDGNLSRNPPLLNRSLYWMRRAGFEWFRNYCSDGIIYSWQFVEPVEGQYDWLVWDTLVQKAQAQGISLLANIGNSVPQWANGSTNWRNPPFDLYHDPMEDTSWYRFVYAMVERYDGDGVADMPGLTRPIRYWEVWNEPDLRQGWNAPDYPAHQFNGDVHDYVRLLQVAYAAIKSADSSAVVIGPAIAQSVGNTYHSNWLMWTWQEFVDAGGLQYLDIVSYHTYFDAQFGYSDDYAWDRQGYIDTHLNYVNTHRGGKPVWITEIGWNGNPTNDYLAKARNFVRSVVMFWERDFVERYFWYSGHESETHEGFDHKGFIQTLNGPAARGTEPDPLFHQVFVAAEVMNKVLADFGVSDRPMALNVGSSARAYKFTKDNKAVWVFWHRNGSGYSQIMIDTGGRTVQKVGLFGEDLGYFSGGYITALPSPTYLTTELDWNEDVAYIAGRVRDASRPYDWDNGVANVTVQATSPGTQTTPAVSRSVQTDADGFYFFEALPEGTYTVSVVGHVSAPDSRQVVVNRQAPWGRASFSIQTP